MKILVLNAGSSSLKFLLMDMQTKQPLAKGVVERINEGGHSFLVYKKGEDKQTVSKPMTSHKEALDLVLEMLTHEEHGVIENISEITAFGHRYVHGGDKFLKPTILTESILKELDEFVDISPLHMPGSLLGTRACMEIAGNIPNVAVFDTSFHGNMPEHAYRYAIPTKDYEDYKIRRYGFHGTSHSFITNEYAKLVNKKTEDVKIITCHLGNGSSISAVSGGHSIDTSMGFTPLEGLVMGTRSGDLDPAVVEFLANKKNMSINETINYLNKRSGLFGLTRGLTSDMRELEENLDNKDCKLALDILNYRLKKYISAYFGVLSGAEAIVFTGGIGENDNLVRAGALSGLEVLGIELDQDLNNANIRGITRKISKDSSKVAVYIIPTNEELVIAEETLKLAVKK